MRWRICLMICSTSTESERIVNSFMGTTFSGGSPQGLRA
jgi:hypothetical protein